MHNLSYETLFNLIDMLNEQINKEEKAVNFFEMDDIKLYKLQQDLKLVKQAEAKKTNQITKKVKKILKENGNK